MGREEVRQSKGQSGEAGEGKSLYDLQICLLPASGPSINSINSFMPNKRGFGIGRH